MSRLIDADAITDGEIIDYLGIRHASCLDDVRDMLNDQPTIEAVPVVERNKIIDEFADRLKHSLIHNHGHLLTVDTDGFEWLTTDAVGTHIDEISERMKGGAE